MNRKNYDYAKYGGYMDPEDNVFFGPVTKRELLRSAVLAEKLQTRRKNACAKNTFEHIQKYGDKSNRHRTFDATNLENLDPVTETNESELNTTYELNESQNPCICPQIEKKENDTYTEDLVCLPKSNKIVTDSEISEVRPHLVSILCDPLKDLSNLNDSFARTKVGAAEIHNPSSTFGNTTKNMSVLQKGSLLDDTCATIVVGHLQTPLIEKFKKSGFTQKSSSKNNKVSLDKTLTNENISHGTPTRFTKLSDTFITDLNPESCLINSSLNDSTHQNTPDIFRQKRNEIWQKNTSTEKSIGGPRQSKLPLFKRTPNQKYLPTKSPVADYIHKGISVKSASKERHSCCLNELNTKSKSEQKGARLCKIPVSTSTNVFAKRKLQMGGETKIATMMKK